ncbi:TonB-dependent receptor plug domain-containing protein [Wenyingzhuangia sp. IMCC45467]
MLRKILLFCFFSISSFAQQIRVVDAYTQDEIEGVEVINKTLNIKRVTNKYGLAVFSNLQSKNILSLEHQNYNNLEVVYENIEEVIYLEPTSEGLESVVLSVSRVAEKKQSIPEHIEIVARKEIDYISPQTSADLLGNIPGIRVQKSQFGGGSPVIRGMESNRVLLVVDGVRMNNAIYRNGHLQNAISVSPFVLERTEVVFGPASVSYGSDALGGVVHYYTKNLNYSKNLSLKNQAFYRHSTVNNEHSTSFSSQLSHQKWASFTNVSFSSFGDLKMGKNRTHGYDDWGKVYQYSKNTDSNYYESSTNNPNPNIQKNTGYHQLDILQKLMFPIRQDIDLVVNGQFSTTNNIPNFGKLNDYKNGDLKFAEWYYGPQQRLLVSAQAKFKDYKSILKNGAITLAYQNILESRINRDFGSLNRTSRFEEVDVYSLNSDFFIPIGVSKKNKLFYGLELVHNQVNSTAKGETLSVMGNKVTGVNNNYMVDTRYPDGVSTYSSAAIYTSYRQELSKKHIINAGLRLTSTLLTANWNQNVSINIPNNELKLSNTALTGSLGYIFKPYPTDKISVVFSKGFRAPNVDDIGKIRSKSGKLTVPNSRLAPEHLYSSEIGFAKNLPVYKLYFNSNVYYTLLNNYIGRAPSAEFGTSITYDGEDFENENILANTNLGKAAIYGATISASWKLFNNVKTNGGITYTKGISYENNEPLSSIPPLFGNISLGVYKRLFNMALDYRFSMAKTLQDYNLTEGIDNIDETPNEEGTPNWSVLNFNSNYYFSKSLRVQFQIQNILDAHYKEFASSISAPGRNFSAAVAYSF